MIYCCYDSLSLSRTHRVGSCMLANEPALRAMQGGSCVLLRVISTMWYYTQPVCTGVLCDALGMLYTCGGMSAMRAAGDDLPSCDISFALNSLQSPIMTGPSFVSAGQRTVRRCRLAGIVVGFEQLGAAQLQAARCA